MTPIEQKRKEQIIDEIINYDTRVSGEFTYQEMEKAIDKGVEMAQREYLDKSIQMVNHLLGRFEDIRLTDNIPYLKSKKRELEMIKQSLEEKK